MRFRRHHVGTRAAGDHTRIHGNSPRQIGESRDAIELTRQFQNRARPRREIHPGVRCLPAHRYGKPSHAFARRLQLAGEPRTGLQHEYRFAGGGVLLRQRTRALATNFFIGIELE